MPVMGKKEKTVDKKGGNRYILCIFERRRQRGVRITPYQREWRLLEDHFKEGMRKVAFEPVGRTDCLVDLHDLSPLTDRTFI